MSHTPSMTLNLDALDYLVKRFPSHSVTEVSQLLLQNGNDRRMVEAILDNDLYAGSGEHVTSPRRNPPPTVGQHPNVTSAFAPSPTNNEVGVTGGTFYTSYGRMQSAPDHRGYSQYERYPQHQSVTRTQSLQQREYPRVGLSPSFSSGVGAPTSDYSGDPVAGRCYNRPGYIPAHSPEQFTSRWTPHHHGYPATKTPDRPLEFRVPSSGSGYSDWSGTSGSEQLTPGLHHMPSFHDPREYQLSTPSDYHPIGYQTASPGEYQPLSGQDGRVYPNENPSGWPQTCASSHYPGSGPDPGYSGGIPLERQPVYSIGMQKYGAISPHGPPMQRPNKPLPLTHQTSHDSSSSSSPGVGPSAGQTPTSRAPPGQQVMSPSANTPTQPTTSNEAYLQALLLHQSAQLESVNRLLESAHRHAEQLQRENCALELRHSQQVSEYSGIPSEDDLEILRGEIQSLETSVDDLQRTLRSPQPTASVMLPDQDQEGPHWACEHCSFLNHPALTRCEVCEIPKRRTSSDRSTAFNT